MSGERPRPQPGCWARVRLVQGTSRLGVWDVTAEAADSRITVGSGDGIDWPVCSGGVEASHFQFYWDGRALWISAPHAGSVLVDGEPVTDWRQLAGRCRVDFGEAAMMVETSSAAITTLSEAVLVEPIPEGSMITDFVDEHEVKTVFFEGTYDFEHGKHQAKSRDDDTTANVGKADKGFTSDVQTVMVDRPGALAEGEVAAPFRGAVHQESEDGPTRKLETALGSRFSRPESSGELDPSHWRSRLRDFKPNEKQIKIGAVISVALVALLSLGAVYAHRTKVAKEQKRITALWEQQQAAQDAIAQRTARALQALNDEEVLAQDPVAKFLDARRIRFTELKAREEAIAEIRRRKPDPRVVERAIQDERLALEKQGADLLFANAFERALPHYRKLAAAHPDEPAFGATVRVLQSKLRCRDGKRSTGEPCR